MTFLLDLRDRDQHVALISVADLGTAERLTTILTAAGFVIIAKHSPDAVEFTIGKGDSGAAN